MYYTGQEIIDIAIRIEENGHEFYTLGAKAISGNEPIRKLFTELAAKEISHIAAFQNIASHFEPESFEFNQEEEADYMNHLADTHIFQKKDSGAEKAKKINSAKQALEIAYQFELESVDFYTELLKKTKKDAVKLIQQIIEEEKEHAAEIKSYM